MSNLQTYYHFKLDFQEVDQHTSHFLNQVTYFRLVFCPVFKLVAWVRFQLRIAVNSKFYLNIYISPNKRKYIPYRKYKDYVYRKMLVQEYLKKWRIFKRVKPKNDMMYHDIYNCICQNTKK